MPASLWCSTASNEQTSCRAAQSLAGPSFLVLPPDQRANQPGSCTVFRSVTAPTIGNGEVVAQLGDNL